MKGTGGDRFSPIGNITIGEIVTLASKVHATYNSKEINAKGDFSNWYDAYIIYAKKNNIIDNSFNNYKKNATRSELVHIFSNSISTKELNSINKIDKIPDVKNNTKYSESILKFYNAGIIKGSDDIGTFKPQTNISRAETAAIMNRLVNKENRLKFELKKSYDISNDLAIKKDISNLLKDIFEDGAPRFKMNEIKDTDILNLFGMYPNTLQEGVGMNDYLWAPKESVDRFSMKYFGKKVKHENHVKPYSPTPYSWTYFYDSGRYYYEFEATSYGSDKYVIKNMKRLGNDDIEIKALCYTVDVGEGHLSENELIQLGNQQGTNYNLQITFEPKGDRYIIKEVLDLGY